MKIWAVPISCTADYQCLYLADSVAVEPSTYDKENFFFIVFFTSWFFKISFSTSIFIFYVLLSSSFLSCFTCISHLLSSFPVPSFPFSPFLSHYLEKHYKIKVLLNDRIRSTVWLQLTLVLVKPLYFLKTTIGDAKNTQGHLWKPLLQCKWAEAQFLWMQQQPLPAGTAAGTVVHDILGNRRNTGLWDSRFFCVNTEETHPPAELGWGSLHQTICYLNHMKLRQIKLEHIML